MSLWHCIMEFSLFRWLFGIHGRDNDGDIIDYVGGYTADRGNRHAHGKEYGRSPYHEDWQSDDGFLEEQEDYDMMDDF